MSETFCLQWDDFQSNASSSFENLRNEDYLHDVTLVSDDNCEIFAHKLVLSACSEYFKNIFKNRKVQTETLLCLNGTSSKDLNNILDYIYFGEVKIQEEELERFLDISQRFKLNGLNGAKRSVLKTESTDASLTRIEEQLKECPRTLTGIGRNIAKEDLYAESKTDIGNIDQQIGDNIEKVGKGIWRCRVCGKEDQKSYNLKRHIERHHMDSISFQCPNCDVTFRSRAMLSDHEKNYCYR